MLSVDVFPIARFRYEMMMMQNKFGMLILIIRFPRQREGVQHSNGGGGV